MVTLADARQALIDDADINTGEWSSTVLDRWLNQALGQHDPNLSWDDVSETNGHLECVVLLASISFCFAEYRQAAQKDALTGGGASNEGWKRFQALKALIESLREQYDLITERLGIGDGGGQGGIKVVQLHRYDPITESTVPYDTQPVPPTVEITVSASGSDVTITWTPPDALFDFYYYKIYRHTSSGIVDLSTLTAETHSGEPGIITEATLVRELTELWHSVYKDASLSAGTYYYVMVVEDLSGKRSFSTEKSVVVS